MAQNTNIAETLKQTVDRNRYFYGKLMTVRDFLREQEYFNNKRWLINRLLFGNGIVCGLKAKRNADTTEIEIEPGVGFDQLGREITVLRTEKIDVKNLKIDAPETGPQQRRVRLCLDYHECPKEPVPSVKSSPCDEVCESNRVSETFIVKLRAASDDVAANNLCEDWLNRRTETQESAGLRIERTAPAWVRGGELFEVALKVTALRDVQGISLVEMATGEGKIVEPVPALPNGQAGQFPTPPVSLQRGEFFIYVYQVEAPPLLNVMGHRIITLVNSVVPLVSTVKVVSEQDARWNEASKRFGDCGESMEDEPCVDVAEMTVHFSNRQPSAISDFNVLGVPRHYNLERVGRLLDCLRDSLQADDGTARPGHAFITFRDTESENPKPISPNPKPGSKFTVARGDHTHELLLYTHSGLEFPSDDGGDRLRINGKVGGDSLQFLHTVSGQTPEKPHHLATKGYVDRAVAGLDWQESVKSKEVRTPPESTPTRTTRSTDDTQSPPASRKKTPRSLTDDLPPERPGDDKDLKAGDRYLLYRERLEGAWQGQQNKIATWNGDEWIFTRPDKATAVFVEDENIAYLYIEQKWMPFLATPEFTAGRGLQAEGAFLNVGAGAGVDVDADSVSVVFHRELTRPIRGHGSIGRADTVARGDHTHALPLARASGLEFVVERESLDTGPEIPEEDTDSFRMHLRINGSIGGDSIDFAHPVSGQTPLSPRHLTTKEYVDARAAGIDWQESVRTKDLSDPPRPPSSDSSGGTTEGDAGGGGVVRDDAGSSFDASRDEEISSPFEPTPRRDDSPPEIVPTHELQKGDRFLLLRERLTGAWRGQQNRIAVWTGRGAWEFIAPDEGMAVFVEDENVAYLYADERWTPFLAMPTVAAGLGLQADGAVLNVGGSPGLNVAEDMVWLEFENLARNIRAIGTEPNPGNDATVARGDHAHEFPLLSRSGIEFSSEVDDGRGETEGLEVRRRGFRINGDIGGDAIVFRHPVAGAEPVADEHLTTKNYVDTAIETAVAGLDWQASVTTARLKKPPANDALTRGNRFLILDVDNVVDNPWRGHVNQIATWGGSRKGWTFQEPNEGMALFVEDDNLSFLFADERWTPFLAPPAPTPVVAGAGLVQSGDALAVGQGDGIIVSEDAVALAYPENPPPPVATSDILDERRRIGGDATVARSDHTHVVPLAADSGIEFIVEGDNQGFRLNGTIGGDSIGFLNPVSGQEPTDARHLATKAYVDSAAPNIVAGDGLARTDDTLSVGAGAGLIANADNIEVSFTNDTPQPLGVSGSAGSTTIAARSDHVHPLPTRTTGTSSGIAFLHVPPDNPFRAESDFIPLNPEESELFYIQAALVQENFIVFGEIESNGDNRETRDGRGFPAVALATQLFLSPDGTGKTLGFRVLASSRDQIPQSLLQARYFIFRPFAELRDDPDRGGGRIPVTDKEKL